MTQTRKPKGTPTGGQFAPGSHDETATRLERSSDDVREAAEASEAAYVIYSAARDVYLRSEAKLFDAKVRQAFPEANSVVFLPNDDVDGRFTPHAVLNDGGAVIAGGDEAVDDDKFQDLADGLWEQSVTLTRGSMFNWSAGTQSRDGRRERVLGFWGSDA